MEEYKTKMSAYNRYKQYDNTEFNEGVDHVLSCIVSLSNHPKLLAHIRASLNNEGINLPIYYVAQVFKKTNRENGYWINLPKIFETKTDLVDFMSKKEKDLSFKKEYLYEPYKIIEL